MSPHSQTQALEKALQRAQILKDLADHPASEGPNVLNQAVEELGTALEELRVAEEELHEQNEELLLARHSLEREHERYHNLFEFAPDGYLVTDQFGTVVEANQVCCQLLNVRYKSLIGKPLIVFVQDSERHAFRSQVNKLPTTTNLHQFEVWIQPRDCAPLYVAISMQWIDESADNTGTIRWMLRDVTARHQAQQQIVELNAHLEQRVRERTVELEAEKNLKEQAFEQEAKARVEAESLRDIAAALNDKVELNDVLDQVLMNMGRVVPFDAANILLVHSDQIHSVRSYRFAEHDLQPLEAWLKETPITLKDAPLSALSHQPALFLHDWQRINGWSSIKGIERIGSLVTVPIQKTGTIIGFLTLYSLRAGVYNVNQVSQLQAFTIHAAIALHNAQNVTQMRELAVLEERQRLARDLHDAVTQLLFSASMITESLPRMFKSAPHKVITSLERLHPLIRGALAEMRTLLLELRPASLVMTPLPTLIEQLLEAAQGHKPIATETRVEGIDTLNEELKVTFYRIAQEALNNVIKHAHATKVVVSLRLEPQRAEMVIADNGVGFQRKASGTGLGLENMEERAKRINAALHFQSLPHQGTQIQVVWRAAHDETSARTAD
jgi:PAS domain S-box-containing protein